MSRSQARTISYEEQQAMGLVSRPTTFVPATTGEVLPPVRAVPAVSDPYVESMPQVQQVVHVDVTPIPRAQAMVMKVNAVTVALAVLTLAAMIVLGEFYFFIWLLLASAEWVVTFVVLAVLDYRETPAAQSRMQMKRYLTMMEREQKARLCAMYGKECVQE
jgi:hypothetical protein